MTEIVQLSRRSFLKLSGATVAAAGLASVGVSTALADGVTPGTLTYDTDRADAVRAVRVALRRVCQSQGWQDRQTGRQSEQRPLQRHVVRARPERHHDHLRSRSHHARR